MSASETITARTEAEQALEAARASGDTRRIIDALTDLGAACVRANEAVRAMGLFDEAVRLAQPLNDSARMADVLGNLALAHLNLSLHTEAIAALNKSLEFARAAGDRAEEKMALYRLGNVWTGLRDPLRAGGFYEQALVVAQAVGDRQHEADLNWRLAIVNEDIGRHEQAIGRAQTTVAILREIQHPHAEWFAEHAEQFRSGDAGDRSHDVNALASMTDALVPGAQLPSGPTSAQTTGPGLLRMAYSAAKSLTRFLGAGLKTVPADERERRLQICRDCPHHTGARCRLCGCFTSAKTWLPHERCPIGKW